MPLISQYNYEDLKPYFAGDRRHFFYKGCVDLCAEFAPHSEGAYPREMIECRRPNEPLEVKEYRELIWVPKTKPTFTRLVSSLGKIRRSSDWSVKYPEDEFGRIAEGEKLEDYCEIKFPYFTSITNWTFGVLLKKYLTDPNGVIMVMPLETDVDETTYLRPYPYIFDSCHVYEYTETSAILVNPAGCWYTARRDKRNATVKGKSYYVVTDMVVEKWDQIDDKETFSLVSSYQHGLGIMPAWKIGAVISCAEGMHFMYESRISGILPDLKEAVREYSDLQAGKVLHIFPERWEYSNHECTNCKGTGRRRNPSWTVDCNCPTDIDCDVCSGRGWIATGPYSKILIKPQAMGEQALPTPPAGYVEKDVEIIRVMEESVKGHIYDALASINFQFLEQTPLNQSGTAKEVDKEELNNTVHAIAEDLVRNMDTLYKFIAYYRYRNLYALAEIDKMKPAIVVPEHYDLLSSQFMQTELDTAKKSGVSPVITDAMEEEYADKRFPDQPEVGQELALIHKLDPLSNVSEDNKMSMLSNKGITQETYIISSNIKEFVQRATDEDADFAAKPLKEQKAKMMEYAKAQVAAATIVPLADLTMPEDEPEIPVNEPINEPATV